MLLPPCSSSVPWLSSSGGKAWVVGGDFARSCWSEPSSVHRRSMSGKAPPLRRGSGICGESWLRSKASSCIVEKGEWLLHME